MLKFDENPASHSAKKENVDQVLHFMAAHRIKMRQISSKGLKKINGNLILLTLEVLIVGLLNIALHKRSSTVIDFWYNNQLQNVLYMDLLWYTS